jgi:DNA polymerase family A
MTAGLPFEEVWLVDFEFVAPPGERPDPVCVCALELKSGRRLRLWRHEFGDRPPYRTDARALFVAYFASAELGCHRALGWPMPGRILDLFTEFRAAANGLPTVAGNSLLGALAHYGLSGMGAVEKDDMRNLILRGGPWDEQERQAILDYCTADVEALARLLPAMLPRIDLPRALLRGRFVAAVAAMEHNGVPVDVETLKLLRRYWTDIQDELIHAIDVYGIYDGRTFKADRWAALLARFGIPWPRLESGRLDLSDDTFRQMAKVYPLVAPYRELRSALAELRLSDLAVGQDGRNRTILSPFGSRTGRNQPSNSKYIFGPSVWLRGLIKPPLGHGIAYVDWSQQEFGIAAALSGDPAMKRAYNSGDPYLEFAKLAGLVPPDATKKTHGPQREAAKACVLGVQYAMGPETLAQRIGQPPIAARDLLRSHREAFPVFWRWSDAAVDYAVLTGRLYTVFGWPMHVSAGYNPRTLRNFPMQANGAEMLRLACCLATERGIEVCAPVHDAVMIASPLGRIEADLAAMQAAMAEASREVLSGFEIRTDAQIVRYPDRYMDPRGAAMWDRVMRLVEIEEREEAAA